MVYSKEYRAAYNKKYRAANLQKHKEYMKTWNILNKEKISARGKAWRKTEEAQRIRRNTMYKFKYGITLDDYEKMYSEQGGKCAICHATPDLLVVDHCHETNKVRGLLCNFCNMAVSVVEKEGFLYKIFAYLER